MTVYLARFKLNGKQAYKVGHTKFYYAYKRFEDDQYNTFESIDILSEIRVSDPEAKIARDKAKLIEACLKAMFPKNFYLEEYFQTERDTFNGLSGITEMFILNRYTEEDLINTFSRVNKEIQKL